MRSCLKKWKEKKKENVAEIIPKALPLGELEATGSKFMAQSNLDIL